MPSSLPAGDFIGQFTHTGPVITIVYAVLLAMSVSSWALILYKAWLYWRARRAAAAACAAFEGGTGLGAANAAADPATCSGRLALEGLAELKRMKTAATASGRGAGVVIENVDQALEQQAQAESDRLYGALSYLSTCAGAAPLLGLFGTVWGIMGSFESFASPSPETISAVIPGLADALGTTALGLVVAIPAVVAYNLLERMLAKVEADLARFRRDFLGRLKLELPEQLACPPCPPCPAPAPVLDPADTAARR
ncbi:MAG: MotA/TolQ/ExbB proton channel family protein [Desulfovibrionaceae bacterium]